MPLMHLNMNNGWKVEGNEVEGLAASLPNNSTLSKY